MHDIIARLYSGRVSSYHPYRESTNSLVKHLIGACFWPVFCVPLLHAVVVRECSVGSLCVVLSISMRRSVGRRGWYSSCFTLASFTEEGRSYRIAIFDIVSLRVHSITVKLQIRRKLAASETFRTSFVVWYLRRTAKRGLHARVHAWVERRIWWHSIAQEDLCHNSCTHVCSVIVPLAWPTEPALGYSSVHTCMDTC